MGNKYLKYQGQFKNQRYRRKMKLIGSVDDDLVHQTQVTKFFAVYYIMALCHSDSVSVLILSLFSLILLFLADKTHQKGIEFN